MPFDGNGTFNPPGPPTFPAVSGEPISSADFNNLISDMAGGLSLTITRDGQGKPTAPINWNGQNLTNVGLLSASSAQVAGKDVGFLDLAQTAISTGYTLVLTDRGKHIYYTGTGHALTIPPNSSVAFPIGAIVYAVNNGSGNLTLTRGSGVALYFGTNANRTLATGGVAVLLKVATDTWFTFGQGIT